MLPVIAVLLILAGCQALVPPPSTPTIPSEQGTSTPAAATSTPSPTPPPMVARVGGSGVTVAEFEAELDRFNAAMAEMQKTVSAEEARQRVLDSLVDEVLLANAALQSGETVSAEEVQTRYENLAAERGGAEGLQTWLNAQGYTEESFRAALDKAILASRQRDAITAAVPTEAEQVHVRQILVLDAAQAQEIHRQLEIGVDFATLVMQYDPLTGGDLGWFPRGYLTIPELDEAVFRLEEGQFTDVIKTAFGYHILQVLERKTAPLSPDALQMAQQQALEDWLNQQRESSQIEYLTP